MGAHAKLSPSGSARWLTCPGSVHLEASLPREEKSSPYAARGTAIHEVSERHLKHNIPLSDFLGEVFEGHTIQPEDLEIAQTYVAFAHDTVGTKFYEVRVSLEAAIPDCFGTVDLLAMRPAHLIVGDLKTGSGVQVFAEENTQLMLYALGAYFKFNWIYDFEKVTLAIIQPPLNHLDVWETTVERLLQFKDEVVAAYKRIQDEPNTFVMSDKACRWCRAIAHCPEQQARGRRIAMTDFEAMRAAELAEYVEMIPQLKAFIEAVEDQAKTYILDGVEVPGFKVVEGRKTRVWVDEEKVVEYFTEKEMPGVLYDEPKLRSVAQLEKALKGTGVEFNHLVTTKAGSPTLAPEKDKRPGLTPGSRAAKDFADV